MRAILRTGCACVRSPSPSMWFFLALTHHRLGHTDEARRQLEQATKWIQEARPCGLQSRYLPEISWNSSRTRGRNWSVVPGPEARSVEGLPWGVMPWKQRRWRPASRPTPSYSRSFRPSLAAI
jgi:hypothetical protein